MNLGRSANAQFRAVGIQTGDDVEGARVHHARDFFIDAILREQFVDQMQCRRAAGDFIGVNVGLDEERGLVGIRAGGEIGDGRQPDVAAFERFADRGQLKPIGLFIRPGFEDRRQFVVFVEFIEADRGHD